MKKVKIVCCLCLLLMGILAISPLIPTLAVEPPLKAGEERISLDTKYPAVEIVPGGSCEFEVGLSYVTSSGEGDTREFDLVTITPKDWTTYITDTYQKQTRIEAIRLDPSPLSSTSLRVVVTSPYWYTPEPGEYPVTLEVISGTLKNSIDLKAVIKATYTLEVIPTTERYNTTATAGKDNYFEIEMLNTGSATIDDITFKWQKPDGWKIETSPEEIDSLFAASSQTVEANIKPPPRTIAGDYVITLVTEGKQTSAEHLEIRVTVETPTIWGWVGVVIIVVVIAGVIFVFMRFSRR